MFATVPPPPQRLLVFARLPEPGRVKTRLAAEIGEERALAVYEAMLRDVVAGVGVSTPETEIEFLWPPTRAAGGAALRRAFAHHAVAMQTGATLGDRLSMAFSERFFFHRTQKIIAVGVDDPLLPRELIDHAFALLDSCEYVVGPAEDGGYYLFGCRALSFDPSVFHDIDWGTATVLDTTLARIAAMNRTFALLPRRFDIDTAADLERFAAEAHGGELARLLRG
ncbi:MAG TPA: TIGR04282 family arsenosugar biosynthesis glycosyltransferase [Thermoanaerobaculia bacterium]|nr:TIGR04282 family arsenosugar biosynthesis glycosyltransferase [Thermoanaerobaculia bacterium]